jgi:DNA-binding transcriptional LysR family regulator
VVLTVNQFFTAGRVVAHSNLLSVMPRHFVRETGMAQDLVLRKLPFDAPAVHVEALWHRRTQHSSAHQWLRQALAQVASRSANP